MVSLSKILFVHSLGVSPEMISSVYMRTEVMYSLLNSAVQTGLSSPQLLYTHH